MHDLYHDNSFKAVSEAMNRIARGDFNVFLDPNDLGFNKYIDSINTMAKELGSMETLRQDFVANVSHEIPDEMKRSLLKQELILEANDREQLTRELSEMGLFHKTGKYIVVPYQDMTAQEVISQLQTKLTLLKIHEPSLEETYIELLKQTGGEVA